MKLLEWVDYQVRVTPEALLVRPIRKLYNADRTQRKEQFMQQMSYLFFMVDPRSTYMYIIDEEEREHQIKLQEGLPDDFKPSKDLLEAMEIYGKHVITSSTRLLEATRSAADALKDELESGRKAAEKIFNPGVTAKPNGIGMGLVIITELLNNHKETIRLETPGDLGGATFVFTLKLA